MMLFSGRGYPELADSIAERLDVDLGEVEITKFSNGEMYARYEESVRGADVFIIQSLGEPVNDNLMELLVMIDAAKRASAAIIVAVIPWYAYSRQDRKSKPREPVTARLVANMIQVAGAARVEGIVIDLPPDIPIDRVGALDGVHTFPIDTPLEFRSLPPTALRPENDVHKFLTTTAIRVGAAITAPWFGRPGGGIRFTLQEPGLGLRDLVVSGALQRLQVIE